MTTTQVLWTSAAIALCLTACGSRRASGDDDVAGDGDADADADADVDGDADADADGDGDADGDPCEPVACEGAVSQCCGTGLCHPSGECSDCCGTICCGRGLCATDVNTGRLTCL